MKRLTYLFMMVTAMVMSFTSCSSDDDNNDDGGEVAGSTVAERCENGAAVSSNSYYIFPCCQWGASKSVVKNAMSNYTLSIETDEPDSGNYTCLAYQISEKCRILYYFNYDDGKLKMVYYDNLNYSSIDFAQIASCLKSDGCSQLSYTDNGENGSEQYVFITPTKSTRITLHGYSGGDYDIYWQPNE